MNVRSDLAYAQETVSEPRDGGSIDLRDLFGIVIRRKALLAPALAVCFALAFAYILLAPVRYTASMSILIDPRSRLPAGVEGQALPQEPDPALVESQMRLLASKAVLRRLIDSQDLLNDPDHKPGLLQQVLEPLSRLLTFGASTPVDPINKLAEDLGKLISVKRGERTYVVDVDVMAHTQAQAVTLANGLYVAYIAEQAKQRDDIVARQTAFLDARVNDLRGRVEQAERRAQDFRDSNAIALLDGHTSAQQQLGGANAALVAARGKVGEVAARYAQLKTALSQPTNFESIDDAIHSPVIERLRQDYATLVRDEAYGRTVLGPRHPSYLTTKAQLEATKAQIKAEIQRILLATERELSAAQASARAAEKLVANTETATNDGGDQRIALTDLERDAATLRATFEKALTASENIRRDVVESPLSLLIDPPVAGNSKTSPRSVPALIIALAAAINLWIVAALIADFRQRSGESQIPPPPDEPALLAPEPPAVIEPLRQAQIPFGGFVERAPWPQSLSIPPDAQQRGASPPSIGRAVAIAVSGEPQFYQAIRSLYERLRSVPVNRAGAPRIALASLAGGTAGPLLALALARIARIQGQRVMIVDCEGDHSVLAQVAEDQRAESASPHQRGLVIVPLGMKNSARKELADQMPFDLILLSCGSLKTAGDALRHWRLADKVLAVGEGEAARSALSEALASEDLSEACLGMVLFEPPIVSQSRASA